MFEFKKIKIILLILVILINIFCNNINAITLSNELTQQSYRIYSYKDPIHYIRYNGVLQQNYEYYYLDESGNKMSAYCINLGIDGPETMDEYYVEVKNKLEDKTAINILFNGYPYKDIETLGVLTEQEAKYSTQFALWTYLSNLDINKIEASAPQYQRVVNCIKNIYTNGINSNSNLDNLLNVNVNNFKIDNLDKNYYSCSLKLDYNDNIKEISLKLQGIENIEITDENNKKIDSITGRKNIKLLVKREDIKESKKLKMEFEYLTKNTVVMFGNAKIEGMQNLALLSKPVETKNVVVETNLEYKPVLLNIKKVDKNNKNLKIEGVKFKISKVEDNKLLGTFVTNKEGLITIDVLKYNIKNNDKLKIEEIEVPKDYYLDTKNNVKYINIKFEGENNVLFENEKISGKIEIIKKSKEYNHYTNLPSNTPLKDVIFDIYDSNMNLITSISTDENGKACIENLKKGIYYIKEKEAPKFYILDEKTYKVEIKYPSQEEVITVYNKSLEKKELPKTGF